MGGVPARQRAGLQVHRLLREVPRLGRGAEALDAPDPPRRREAVRGLRRPDHADRGRRHRRDPPRADLRGGAGRVELHLRLRHRHPDGRRLGRLHHRRAGVHRRRAPADRARPAPGADRQARPLRPHPGPAGRRSSRPTTAWRCCRRARSSARQAQGRSRRAGRRALDPGAAAPPALLQPGRAQRGHRRAAGRAEPAPVQEAARLPALGLPGAGRAGAAAAAGQPHGHRALQARPRQHRLPRRTRRPLLQRAAPAGAPARSSCA